MSRPTAEDDASWEAAEGVPSMEDNFIQNWLEGRDALVAQEKKQRSDRVFRENLSPTAAEACAIVDQIRFEEQQTLWTREYEDSLGGKDVDVFPGMMFMLAKERMEKSKLWKIVRRMPKGALLHCHLQAMVEPEFLIREAFKIEGIHCQSPVPLVSDQDRLKSGFTFSYQKSTAATTASSIWSSSYETDKPVSMVTAADTFPNGGREGFIKWVVSRSTITPDESISHHEGLNEVWRKFSSCFLVIGSLITYEPVFRIFLQKMFGQLLEDGVQWVDMRATFVQPFMKEGAEEYDKDFSGLFQVIREELEKFKSSEEGKDFWGGRMIWTSLRILEKRAIISDMKACIELKKAFPDLIAGYDLVGQEDLGRPLQDLVPELFWFKKRCMEEGVDIPFFFHAGETLGDGSTTDENLFDAVLLGTRRIGHGFSLFKHPLLIDMIKEKKILIESCPVSNEVLRLTSSILAHPLPALLARGVPVSLCNDDPGLLGQGVSGMTHDFWQALQGWDNLGLAGLGSLAENSVRWAAFEDYTSKEWVHEIKMGAVGKGVRAEKLKEWIQSWEKFCQWIVTEYGADEDFEGDT
ncbi:Metallo-dependent hydrolase [Aulographum hederae CBS 113979]|uniref:adenosine deaminase n=1 Tax=Aulographum hederae CBS 113979 TaxID=1176131 RepID=A0A6G1H5Q1_9PEZI|nr:Metallo-dependent hydrolase [Aulographum hederae CBS 113979]